MRSYRTGLRWGPAADPDDAALDKALAEQRAEEAAEAERKQAIHSRLYDLYRCPRCKLSFLSPEVRGPIPLFCRATNPPARLVPPPDGPLPPCPDFILGGRK